MSASTCGSTCASMAGVAGEVGRAGRNNLDPTLARQASPDTLQTHAAGLKPGAYKLQWQVLASDGHMSKGEIPFTVN